MADGTDGLSMSPPPFPKTAQEETVDLDDDGRLTAIYDEDFTPFYVPDGVKKAETPVTSGPSTLIKPLDEPNEASSSNFSEVKSETLSHPNEADSAEDCTAQSFSTARSFSTVCSISNGTCTSAASPANDESEGQQDNGQENVEDEASATSISMLNEVTAVQDNEECGGSNDDDFGDFGDFGSFEGAADGESERLDSTQSETDPWAASFEETAPSAVEEDDWAADFASAPAPSTPTTKAPPILPHPPSVEPLLSLEAELEESSFWGVDDDTAADDEEVPPFYDLMSAFEAESPSEHLRSKFSADLSALLQCTLEAWLALRVVEESRALKFGWNDARLQRRLLQVLRMHTPTSTLQVASIDNVLKPTLAPLQPVKVNGTADRIQNGTAEDKKPSPTPAQVNVSPPADFDWKNAGLADPLSTPAATAALIDPDFFEKRGGRGGAAGVSTLQNDLAEFGLSTTPGSAKFMKASNISPASAVIEKLLRSGEQKKEYRAPSELSLDARALHDRLPDIAFLSSKVLHFPIGKQ